MKKVLVSLALLVSTGCGGLREPAFYEARRVPVAHVESGLPAYYINERWYVHENGRWRLYLGEVAVTHGRDYLFVR